jgi:hypothetical protein
MPDEPQTIAPLEDFIATFNRYETEAGVFALRDEQGYPWWDLVRYRVQFALCVEHDFYGRSSAPPSSKLGRAQSFVRQIRRLLRDIAQLRGRNTKQARLLIVSRRSLIYIENVAAAEAVRGHGALLVNKTGDVLGPHMAITSQSIQFFTRLAQRAQRLPPEVAQEARRLADDIRARFDSEADIFGVIAAKYREELVARRVWSFILDRAGAVERVIYVNDDMLKSLVVLARARGIDTEEVQHAYMGRAHIGFSYPPLDSALATLPDKVIVTRDTGDITYPVEQVMVKTEVMRRIPVARDIDVLIGSSPTQRQETADVVAALVGQGLRLAVKLHPAETKETSAIAARFSPEEVVIHAGDEDFCDLAWRARLFVPINATSTTSFEAAEMGSRVVLVDIGGKKITAITDGVASAHAGSLQALPGVVRSQLALTNAETDILTGDEQ